MGEADRYGWNEVRRMDGPDEAPAFGILLREYRLRAGLSQDRLAERAGISAKAVGAVEQGARQTPHRQTVVMLADALELSEAEREALYRNADTARARARRDRTAFVATSVPRPLTPFIERSEVDDIAHAIGEHRLVTITGSGGVGKTRTAIEVCSRRMQVPNQTIAFIDLTSATDGGLALSTIASSLNVTLSSADPMASLTAAVGSRTLLLVLDNCEHLVAEVATIIARLLASCAALSFLATSREVLSLSGEVVYRLPSLKIPENRVASMDEARAYSAIALFLARASFADAQLELGVTDIPAIVNICQRLDGIPLAIELAASQLPKMGLKALRTRLHRLFDTAGPRDFPARQQTMRATISWSVDLLSDREQTVLMRLSCFSGGFTIEAAESVAAAADIDAQTVLEIVAALTAKSLVNVEWQTGSTRYTMLDSIRTFGRDMLDARGDTAATARRHAEWFAAAAEGLVGKPQSSVQELRRDLDNARAAIAWCTDVGDQAMLRLAARIITGARRLWSINGSSAELDELIHRLLNGLADVAENFETIGDLYYSRVSITNAIDAALFDKAKQVLERSSKFEDAAMVDVNLALRKARVGAFDEATASYSRATRYFDADAQRRSSRNYMHYRCIGVWLHAGRGDLATAHADVVELQRRAEPHGDADQLAAIYQLRAEVASASGDFREAIELSTMLLERCKSDLAFHQVGTIMSNLSCYYLLIGNLEEAERCGQRALERLADWQNDRRPWDAVIAMQHLATTWARLSRPQIATIVLGFIDAYRAMVGWRLSASDQRSYDMLVRSVAEQLMSDEIARHRGSGALLDYEAAVELMQLQDR